MKGYYNKYGFVLILDNGDIMQFATEQEAQEYLKEEIAREEEVKNRYSLYMDEGGEHYIVWDNLFNKQRCKCGKKGNKIEEVIEQFRIQSKNIRSGKPE